MKRNSSLIIRLQNVFLAHCWYLRIDLILKHQHYTERTLWVLGLPLGAVTKSGSISLKKIIYRIRFSQTLLTRLFFFWCAKITCTDNFYFIRTPIRICHAFEMILEFKFDLSNYLILPEWSLVIDYKSINFYTICSTFQFGVNALWWNYVLKASHLLSEAAVDNNKVCFG